MLFFLFLFLFFFLHVNKERSKQCYSYTSCHNSYCPTVQENLGSDVAALPRQERNPIRRQSIQWKAFSPPQPPHTRALLCLRCASSCLYYLLCHTHIVLLPTGEGVRNTFRHYAAFVLVRRWIDAQSGEKINFWENYKLLHKSNIQNHGDFSHQITPIPQS